MHLTQPMLAAGLLFSLTTLNAEAALTRYTSVGENLVYNSVSDITWTADGNLLGTMISDQGYANVVNAIIAASPVITDTPNYYDGSYGNYDGDNGRPYSGQYSLSAADFSSSHLGLTTWFGAQGFVNYLNSIDYGGTKQWALPTARYDSFNQGVGSELGQLFYNELGGTMENIMPNTINFINEQGLVYWSGTEAFPDSVWAFDTWLGFQHDFGKPSTLAIWAVSPGQVSAVPIPGAVWLFGTGLVGLLSLKRRGHAGL